MTNEELGDQPLSWDSALDNVEPAEAYDPIPENLHDFAWTWPERASRAAQQTLRSRGDRGSTTAD